MGKWKRVRSNKRRWQKNHLINRDGAICKICKKGFASKKDITIDHIIPFSKGGLDEVENFQLAHLECNQEKGAMLPEEFEAFQDGKVYNG